MSENGMEVLGVKVLQDSAIERILRVTETEALKAGGTAWIEHRTAEWARLTGISRKRFPAVARQLKQRKRDRIPCARIRGWLGFNIKRMRLVTPPPLSSSRELKWRMKAIEGQLVLGGPAIDDLNASEEVKALKRGDRHYVQRTVEEWFALQAGAQARKALPALYEPTLKGSGSHGSG